MVPQLRSLKFNIEPSLNPIWAFSRIALYIRFHSSLIECFILFKVANIEFNFAFLNCKCSEIKPLKMANSVRVYSHEYIVLVWTHLDSNIKISPLKSSIKFQFIGFNCRVHASENSRCLRLEITVKLAKESCQLRISTSVEMSVFKLVFVLDLFMHFICTRWSKPWITMFVPR